jgi:recombination protein RecR
MQRDPIAELVNQLAKLPGIGEKTAMRLTFHILGTPRSYAQDLSQAILQVKERITLCSLCCDLTEANPCALCRSPRRDRSKICVVERATDLRAVEATGEYRGLYHVLHGVLSPLEGIGPDDIKLRDLVTRLQDRSEEDPVTEVIVATNPSTDGETTALYISRMMTPLGITVSRIASGIPMGGDLEYTDKATLGRAMAHRRQI